ncbi:MAG: DUF86 domain-containing protein [Nanoarchaeota archaeon]|nr:DUF86 domain-containing protein [Nanoarchaeota archaeon]
MTEKEDIIFVKHILDSTNAIKEFSVNLSKEELSSNRLKQNAIVREIEIIGEASKNISNKTKDMHQEVKWKEIVGTRDKMIHHYFGIDITLLWEIIKRDIPILEKQMQNIKEDLDK